MTDRESLSKDSAVASTMRVFPEPVGPRKRNLPIGRPAGNRPEEKVWNAPTISCVDLTPLVQQRNGGVGSRYPQPAFPSYWDPIIWIEYCGPRRCFLAAGLHPP